MPSVPRRKVNAVVASGRLADVFDAVCEVEGRHPHDLVADVMRVYLDRRGAEPAVASVVTRRRREAAGLRVVDGTAS